MLVLPAPGQPVPQVGPVHALGPGHQHVEQHPVELVQRRGVVVGGHDGVGLAPVDGGVGQHVGGEQVVERPHEVAEGQEPAGREGAEHVGLHGVAVDLVQREPVPAPVGQPVDGGGHPAGEALRAVEAQPEVLAEPVRVGEVVEARRSGAGPGRGRRRGWPGSGRTRLVVGALAPARTGPTRPRGGRRRSRRPRPGRDGPRSGPRTRRRRPTAPPVPTAPSRASRSPARPGR